METKARTIVTQTAAGEGGRAWRGLTLQLFLVTVLPLTVLVLGVTYGGLELHHRAMRALVADRDLRAVEAAAAGLEREITRRGALLELLSARTAAADLPGIFAGVERQLAAFDGGAAALDAQGKILAVTGDRALEDWLSANGGPAPSVQDNAEYLPVLLFEGEAYVPVRVARADGSALWGLFSARAVLAEVLDPLTESSTLTAVVVDAQNQMLYQRGALPYDQSQAEQHGIQSALDGLSGIHSFDSHHGEHVIASGPVRPVGWALMVEESWEDIASPMLNATQYAPLIAIPILALSLLALWFGLRRIVQPLQALEAKAEDLARGDFDSIRRPVGGVPEIRRLQDNLVVMAAQLKEAQSSLHHYIGAITASVESERKSLARELHDDTLQLLVALGQNAQYALHWNQDPKVTKILEQAVGLVEQGGKNLRRLVQGLRPIYIEDLGLAAALDMQANEQARPEGPALHFQREGAERRYPAEVELALYRIAQEALNNALHHAAARNIWITLHFRPEGVALTISDDGRGFAVAPDPLQFARRGHYGLLGMQERCELIGARLALRSSAEDGTRVTVTYAAAGEADNES